MGLFKNIASDADLRRQLRRTGRVRENELQKEIDSIITKINYLSYSYDIAINEKAIFRRAGKEAKNELKARAAAIRDTGNLTNSVDFVLKRAKRVVYLGYDYKNKKGQHGHLIELGWVKRNGEYKEGYHLVKKTYESKKQIILSNLISELQKVTGKTLNKIKLA
jgi:hypothetical protein